MSHPVERPHTKEDIERIREIFCEMPSYCDGHLNLSDYPEFIKKVKIWKLTDEAIDSLIEMWRSQKGDTVYWEELEKFCTVVHNTDEYAAEIVKQFDTNGNGFISVDEFAQIFDYLKLFDPTLETVSFETFTLEADLIHDGIVSVQEAQAWVDKKIKK